MLREDHGGPRLRAGSLISNLDFLESIFGNAGDPFVPMNDAVLDVEHWSGHTGCVILAPHLTSLTKREVGLPHVGRATQRQQRNRMCWENENERYNDGEAFKVTCRTDAGVIVTIIADNYFGYCKKEVKTQISYAANLMGGVEEEHAGGALVFPGWSLGEELQVNSRRYNGRTFEDVVREYGHWIDVKPEGYGVDKKYPNLVYIPEDARADLRQQDIRWVRGDSTLSIPLLPGKVYMAPSGYKIRMEKHPSAPSWRIIGTAAEGTFCHKPNTVSGGGKSEISKSIVDYMQYGSVFVAEIDRDLDMVQEIVDRKFADRWTPEMKAKQNYKVYPSRPILSPLRSLGSVIKLLTPSEEYTEEYNAWLKSIPAHVLCAGLRNQAILQPGVGQRLAVAFQRRLRQWQPRSRIEGGRPQDRGHVSSRRSFWRSRLADVQGPAGFRGVIESAERRRHQRVGGRADAIPGGPRGDPAARRRPAHTESAPTAVKFVTNCEHRLFQRPTTRSIAASTSRPKQTWQEAA